jgi:hypothetical protein
MKKTLFVTALLFAMSFSVQAQLLQIGVKAGLNYANATGTGITVNNTNYKNDAITSYHAGLVARIGLTKGIAFQPELLYTTQGATYKDAFSEFTNELGYIAIPAVLILDLNKTFSLELGPQASFLLSEKKAFNVEDSNSFDFSVVGGLGIKITKSIFVQARYGLGLTEVSANAQAKNSVLQLSAGLLF